MKSFLEDRRQAISSLSKLLNRTEIGRQLLTIVRALGAEARAKALVKNIRLDSVESGFVFGISQTTLRSRYLNNLGSTTTQRYLNMAAALGLISRITEEEAGGIDQCVGILGIPMQRYRLEEIDRETVRSRWRKLQESALKVKDWTIEKLNKLFSVSIGKIPEAFDERLRAKKLQEEADRRLEIRYGLNENWKIEKHPGYIVEYTEVEKPMPRKTWGRFTLLDKIREEEDSKPSRKITKFDSDIVNQIVWYKILHGAKKFSEWVDTLSQRVVENISRAQEVGWLGVIHWTHISGDTIKSYRGIKYTDASIKDLLTAYKSKT